MKRLLIIAAIAVIVAPAFAGSNLLPINGTQGILSYDAQTGQINPVTADTRRLGPSIWSAVESTGYFFGIDTTITILDWGDIAPDAVVGGLGMTEYTNSQASAGDNIMIIGVYANDNGGNTQPKQLLAGFILENIPGSTHPPTEYWGYIWRLEIASPYFTMTGNDLDGDNLNDFSYIYYFPTIRTPNSIMGPGINGAADPNVLPPTCPGIENAFDEYGPFDPNGDPNLATTTFIGTYWFGGNPFAQFYWEMFAPGCPNPGAHFKYCAGDIGNYNCMVDLADLAKLLTNYGLIGDATYAQGDIYPPDDFFPGDGDINLSDLAEMLGQYGDDCRWPRP